MIWFEPYFLKSNTKISIIFSPVLVLAKVPPVYQSLSYKFPSFLTTIIPVSYTHLDVYKRQVVNHTTHHLRSNDTQLAMLTTEGHDFTLDHRNHLKAYLWS